MKVISEEFAEHLLNLLENSKINSQTLLIEHDEKLGRTTDSNKWVAIMYEKEIHDLGCAAKKIKDALTT